MDNDPLLPVSNTNFLSRRKPQVPSALFSLCPLPEEDEVITPPIRTPSSPSVSNLPSSFKDRIIFGNFTAEEDHFRQHLLSPVAPSSSSADCVDPAAKVACPSPRLVFADDPSKISKFYDDPSSQLWCHGKSNLHRSSTAPAMTNINELFSGKKYGENSGFVGRRKKTDIRKVFVFLLLYLAFGVFIYTILQEQFFSDETHLVVDALYFSIVTMCTIGYGDITPSTVIAKLFSIFFVIVGFGFIDVLLTGMVSHILDIQESLILSAVSAKNSSSKKDKGTILVDIKKGRMRIRMKVAIALVAVVLCVGLGASVLHFVERLGWIDSFYLSVMSVTTVGYGDHAFKTLIGRLFASIWLLLSTLVVARAFLYLAEARIHRRNKRIAKFVLGRGMTVSEFLRADIERNGVVSKSEYVVYKLREMGMITGKDIEQICTEFGKLDAGNRGKISLQSLVDQ